MTNEELLNYAIEHGMLDMKNVHNMIMKEERTKLLSKHQYKIFQDKDGRWKTTLPDKNSKNGRKLVARKKKEDLEDAVIEYYKENTIKLYKIPENVTLEQLYPIWIESRLLEVNSIGTVKKNDQDWRRYYLDSSIIKIPMKDLSVNQLRDWAHNIINKHKLNKRDYYNMAVIIKKCYEYIENENICPNIWKNVKINTSKLQKIKKKENNTQIYFNDEKEELVKYCLAAFIKRPWNITALAIPFLFITGLRIGELVALKYEDIANNKIIIRRSEVNDFEYVEKDKKMKYKGKEIVDHAKTDAGTREIPLTKGAKQIINLIKQASVQYNYHDEGYIFCPNSRRITSNSIDKRLYAYCERIGIPKKSAHKIRKTYISQIIKDGVDLDTVCRVSGHVDLKTTFESYLFCLEREDEIDSRFEEILELPGIEDKLLK
ncbi:MAG: site-specific integrase [Lachnospiraceae bacterium]|nr:site-specific integrase [Lachnospiraceae bacterium]